MKILSLNVGEPRTVRIGSLDVTTGIFKSPVSGRVMLRRLNLDGDRQADLEVHGGPNKAVYAYPSEHYPFWRAEFRGIDLPWGMFGENFTTEGLHETDACIGDRYRFGEAVVRVSQPRVPCYKLGVRFERNDIVKRFLDSRRSGIYFSVVEEGQVREGDAIERIHKDANAISIADVNRAYVDSRADLPLLRRIVKAELLPAGWQRDFAEELASLEDAHSHSESEGARN